MTKLEILEFLICNLIGCELTNDNARAYYSGLIGLIACYMDDLEKLSKDDLAEMVKYIIARKPNGSGFVDAAIRLGVV